MISLLFPNPAKHPTIGECEGPVIRGFSVLVNNIPIS